MDPLRLLGISGSLRRGSFNTALLRVARQQVPEGVDLAVRTLGDIPLYNRDVEAEVGFPEPVARLRREVAEADGLVVATPEYNFSVPGVLKNAIDWLSRPPDPPIDRKPTAILGGAGGSGSRRAQAHLRDIFRHNQVDVLTRPEVYVVRVRNVFDEDLRLRDESVAADIRKLMETLVARIAERRGE